MMKFLVVVFCALLLLVALAAPEVSALSFTGTSGKPTVAKNDLVQEAAGNCSTCFDGQQCCGDYQTCCLIDGAYSCCATSGSCCSGTCCGSDAVAETCCDGYCCIEETTYCCAKSATFGSRCCPRWSICCDSEFSEYGCCMAAHYAWNWDDMLAFSRSNVKMVSTKTQAQTTTVEVVQQPKATASDNSTFMHSLWMETTGVFSTKIDSADGTRLSQASLDFNNYGEMTRIFAYDEPRQLFYYLEADFVSAVPVGQPGRTLTLYTVDPSADTVTSVVVQGAYNFPTAFIYNANQDVLIAATQADNEQMQPEGEYAFYKINVGTGQAKWSGNVSTTAADPYAGFFHAASKDGSTLYRIGYQNVTTGQNQGISTIDWTVADANGQIATTWTALDTPSGHAFYTAGSLHTHKDGFISIANRQGSGATEIKPSFDLMYFDLDGNNHEVAYLGNAHEPPYFGPVAEQSSLDETQYVIALVEDGALTLEDKWCISVVDLTQSDTLNATVLSISPGMLAASTSVAALGTPMDFN